MDKLFPFNNHLPVKVRFGNGIAKTLPEVVKEVASKHVFLMVDDGIEKFNPAADAVIKYLQSAADIKVTVFGKPAGEPTIAMVDDATNALKASGADSVVALGGGSVIDTAKAARLCAQLNVRSDEHTPELQSH